MSGVHDSQQDVDIDLGGLFGAIWRNRMRVLLATVACAGAAFVAANLITPRYKSEARILIETREPAFTTGQDRSQGRDQPAYVQLDGGETDWVNPKDSTPDNAAVIDFITRQRIALPEVDANLTKTILQLRGYLK